MYTLFKINYNTCFTVKSIWYESKLAFTVRTQSMVSSKHISSQYKLIRLCENTKNNVSTLLIINNLYPMYY